VTARLAFRQADLSRALKGARKGGVEVGRIEVDPRTGAITLFPAGQVREDREADDVERRMEEAFGQ
jgi:hypothetical protein